MEDMEDMVKALPEGEAPPGAALAPQVRLHRQSREASGSADDALALDRRFVPGTARVWAKTFGCSHNVSDGEYMAGLLEEFGYELVADPEAAEVWLLNSCTVKDPSQAAFLHVVKKGQAAGKAVVVSGCVPQADRSLVGLEEVSMIGISQIDRVVEVVEQALGGNTMRLLAKKALPRLDLPKIRKNQLVEIVPLSTGCLGSCTYCKTRHARGKLGSYALEAIVSRVEHVLAEVNTSDPERVPKEIWLASEDTGAYGRDLGTDLGTLLERLTQVLEARAAPDRMLRLGMTNPPFILAQLDRVSACMRHANMFKFVHMPVQSGNNKVLAAMKREYSVEDFCLAADYMLKHVPGLTLATDIICGFPGETEDEFADTLALVERYRFPVLNISQFYPRPGTPAAKMRRLPTQVVKDRSRRLSALFESYKPFGALLGKQMNVWVSEEVAKDKDGGQTVAHSDAYVKTVISPRDDSLVGKRVLVEVVRCEKFHVHAKLV